jgi:transposase
MAKRVVFETGPLSVWFFHALAAEGLPAICIDARHAKAALDMAATKRTPTMLMGWRIWQRSASSARCA